MDTRCLHHWFESQAKRTPHAVAANHGDQRLTYAQLDRRANQLAHRLRRLGVGPDVLVALYLDRSLETIVGILGVLKAGGAYLPLDLAYPRERLAFMLQDAEPRVLLTQRSLDDTMIPHGVAVVSVDENLDGERDCAPDVDMTPTHLAYCMYTSGSTGNPKGVLITHSNVVRLFTATDAWFRFSPTDVWTMFHSYAFDLSVWECWGALLYGGRLVMVSYPVSRSPVEFYELLEREAVTVLTQTPSAFRQLVWAESSARTPGMLRLRSVIFGGEKLELQMLKPWFERHGDQQPQLINMYGITETTVHVTYRPISVADLDGSSVIGQPIPDLQVQLRDDNGQPAKDGQPGEIWVAGPGVAPGYLNREQLTLERFVTVRGEKMYRSGDLARRLPSGDLEYIGRIDNQVKIRGHRIELGEIESVLVRHEAVQAAVVIASEERLAAYIVLSGAAPTVSDLHNFVAQHVPAYMVPASFVFLDALPLTTNGKVDRKALPSPGNARPHLVHDYVAPTTAAETALVTIWSALLDITPVGVDDNFFELGGDSIRLIQVLAQAQDLGIALTTAQLYETPTIRALADAAAPSVSTRRAIAPFALIGTEDRKLLSDDVEDAYPMAALQKGMHYHSELRPDSGIFHDVFSYRIGFEFDLGKLQSAVQQLVEQHVVLRTSFDFANFTEPIQMVHVEVPASMTAEDVRTLTPERQHEALLSWIDAERRRAFDCSTAPLVRFQVQRCGDEEFQFFVSFHHGVLDGWSLAVLVAELMHDYAARCRGGFRIIEPPKAFYRDYVAQELEAIASAECREFWAEVLEAADPQSLPRWPRGFRKGGVEQVEAPTIQINQAVLAGLNRLAGIAGVPLRTVLLAAHYWIIGYLSGQDDVVIGVVMNGRPEVRDGERMLGVFLNVVPVRAQLTGGTWLKLVRGIYEAERASLPYRHYPLSEIQRLSGDSLLFEASFNYVNWHVFQDLQETLDMQFREGPYFEANDLSLLANFSLDVSGKQLSFHFDYDPEQFAELQIQTMGNYYSATLAAMAEAPTERYDHFNPLTVQERQLLLTDWNETNDFYPRDRCVHELFEAQAQRTPEATALVLGDEQLTYDELDRRADRLARHLRCCGVKPDDLVGICMDRSLELIVAMLGVLKAGGAYVPIDPSYPHERRTWMIEDTGMRALLTHSGLPAMNPVENLEVICVDTCHLLQEPSASRPPLTSDNLAYVMYTSGSTGIPKGVAVPHRAVARLLFGKDYVSLDSRQILLHLSSVSFDASTFEVWGALLHGARCVLCPEQMPTPERLGNIVRRYEVTTLWLTAALFNAVIDEAPQGLREVQQLIVGGEALSVPHIRRGLDLLPDTRFVNGYGPTESTTFACSYRIPRELPEDTVSIPIGRPISNTQVYILNADLEPVPVGVTGELFIGGDGLARGYWNRPELTAEKFIMHSFDDGPRIRLYRTGDFARYLPGGNIEFRGRLDQQVKLRGFRVELGEIEAVLKQSFGVKDAAVLVREDQPGDRRLVGYVVGKRDPGPSTKDLRKFLTHKLPVYMIPGTFVSLPALPLDANGKVNRRELPAPGQGRPELRQRYESPRNAIEDTVAQIWCNVLKLEHVGIHDSFFELGGHSLTAMQVLSRLRRTFPIDITWSMFFDHPTVASLAQRIQHRLSE